MVNSSNENSTHFKWLSTSGQYDLPEFTGDEGMHYSRYTKTLKCMEKVDKFYN